MRIRSKILSFVRSQPYPSSPFASRSSSQKSITVNLLPEVASHLSAGNPCRLYNHLFNHARVGRTLPDLQHAARAKQILDNIKEMHSSAAPKHKSSVLSLAAGLYSRAELNEADFR